MTYERIIPLVKSKAKKLIKDSSLEDEDLIVAVDEIIQVIKNYCMIPDVPEALSYTVANMSVDLLKYDVESNKKAEVELDVSKLDTLNIGDTTIKFANERMQNSDRQTTLKSHTGNLDLIVMNYKQQLNLFRRLY